MKKVTYKTLKGQNFLSIGNDMVPIDYKSGLNLVTGKNLDNPERKNAIGKSALAELHFFAQFGKTIREIKRDFIVNNITKGKGLVEMTFDVDDEKGVNTYTIQRTVKPSSVTLLRGETDITKDSIKNTDEYICELLGTNPTLAKSCDILSLSDNIPFMAKKPDEKKKFINDIFSLEIFGSMMKLLKEEIKENNKDKTISSTKIDEIINTITTLNRKKDEHDKQLKERKQVLLNRKKDIEKDISNTEVKISEIVIDDVSKLEESLNKWGLAHTKASKKIDEIKHSISENGVNIKILNGDIKTINSVDGVECDKCLQSIPHTHADVLVKRREDKEHDLLSLENNNSCLNDSRISLQKKCDQMNEKIEEIKSSIRTIDKNKQNVATLIERLTHYKKNLETLEDDMNIKPIDFDVESVENRKNVESETLSELKIHGDDMDVCKFILGEEGVKSFIVKRLLTMLNSSIQEYINSLGMTMRCTFDEYFDEKIVNSKGGEISYWNLSGGERRTVDISCAWAFKDIRKKISGVSSNVEWMDEIMDSAFDLLGFEKLVETVLTRIDRYNLSIYTISHRSEAPKYITGEIVELEKCEGVTRRVNYIDK